MTKVNFYRRFIVYFIFFGIIISIASGMINYVYHSSLQKDILKEQAQEIYTINIKNNFQPTLHNLENTLLNLSHNEILKQYIETKDETIKEKLQLMFLSTANANNNLMQVRYLSKVGKEIIRIDRDKTTLQTSIIPDNKLQDKSDRYYFIESSQLENNRIWYSQLDLNIENGKIEVPYKATLRIATPLFINTKFEGIIILNLHATELLQSISHSNVFEHYILDSEHNYIIHPNDTYSFNKYKGIQRDISYDFPNGIKDPLIFQYPLKNILHNKDHALFILKPKDQYLQKYNLAELQVGIYALLINIFLSTIIAFLLAKRPTELQEKLLEVNKKLSKSNQQLKESKLFSESILNNSAHAIIATDLNGTITLFNKQAQKLLGYSEEDMVGKQTPAIFHQKSQVDERAKQYSQELKKEIKNEFEVFIAKTVAGLDNEDEWVYISKHGMEFYVSLHITALKDTSGKTRGYMGIAEDITHKKYLSKQLDEQKDELQTIFNTTKDGIAILDLQTNFLYFNNAYLKMTGFTKDELLEKSCAGLSAPEDLQKAKDIIKETIEKGHVENFEKTCIVKDNKKVRISMSLALMPDKQRILISTKDITEAKKKQRQLKDYIKIVDQNVITSSTDLQGKITYVSEAFCKISGYSKEELLGKRHNIVKHPDMPDTIYKNLWEAITNNEVWVGEIKNRKKDGGYYWVKASISPVFCEDGTKKGYTAIRQDITDKKIIEEISITDGLTNIYNRRHFNDLFPKIINSAKRDNDLVSFLIMDIDHFKQYNDTYGHQMGDEVLIQVASAIKNSLHRADDHCFRLGGEEFGVIFKADTKEKAKEFANTIRQNIENLQIEHVKNSASSYVTASMGLICKNANEIKSDDEVYKQGDELLYIAKENGRNRVAF